MLCWNFLNYADEEEDEAMRAQYKNPAIHQAFDVLEQLSADEETRLRAEAREKALKNAASELASAREEGKLIGAILMLQRVLKHSMSPEEELAQKSVKELKKMLQQLEAELN